MCPVQVTPARRFMKPSAPTIKLSADQLQQAREWVADCQWQDIHDADDVAELSQVEIERGIDRHYDGGLLQFILDCTPIKL